MADTSGPIFGLAVFATIIYPFGVPLLLLLVLHLRGVPKLVEKKSNAANLKALLTHIAWMREKEQKDAVLRANHALQPWPGGPALTAGKADQDPKALPPKKRHPVLDDSHAIVAPSAPLAPESLEDTRVAPHDGARHVAVVTVTGQIVTDPCSSTGSDNSTNDVMSEISGSERTSEISVQSEQGDLARKADMGANHLHQGDAHLRVEQLLSMNHICVRDLTPIERLELYKIAISPSLLQQTDGQVMDVTCEQLELAIRKKIRTLCNAGLVRSPVLVWDLTPDTEDRECIDRTGGLCTFFKPQFWFGDVVISVVRFIISSIIMFVTTEPYVEFGALLTLLFGTFVLSIELKPYTLGLLNLQEIYHACALFIIALYGFLHYQLTSSPGPNGPLGIFAAGSPVSTIVLVICSSVPIAPAFFTLLDQIMYNDWLMELRRRRESAAGDHVDAHDEHVVEEQPGRKMYNTGCVNGAVGMYVREDSDSHEVAAAAPLGDSKLACTKGLDDEHSVEKVDHSSVEDFPAHQSRRPTLQLAPLSQPGAVPDTSELGCVHTGQAHDDQKHLRAKDTADAVAVIQPEAAALSASHDEDVAESRDRHRHDRNHAHDDNVVGSRALYQSPSRPAHHHGAGAHAHPHTADTLFEASSTIAGANTLDPLRSGQLAPLKPVRGLKPLPAGGRRPGEAQP
jgi:hypothetical protein